MASVRTRIENQGRETSPTASHWRRKIVFLAETVEIKELLLWADRYCLYGDEPLPFRLVLVDFIHNLVRGGSFCRRKNRMMTERTEESLLLAFRKHCEEVGILGSLMGDPDGKGGLYDNGLMASNCKKALLPYVDLVKEAFVCAPDDIVDRFAAIASTGRSQSRPFKLGSFMIRPDAKISKSFLDAISFPVPPFGQSGGAKARHREKPVLLIDGACFCFAPWLVLPHLFDVVKSAVRSLGPVWKQRWDGIESPPPPQVQPQPSTSPQSPPPPQAQLQPSTSPQSPPPPQSQTPAPSQPSPQPSTQSQPQSQLPTQTCDKKTDKPPRSSEEGKERSAATAALPVETEEQPDYPEDMAMEFADFAPPPEPGLSEDDEAGGEEKNDSGDEIPPSIQPTLFSQPLEEKTAPSAAGLDFQPVAASRPVEESQPQPVAEPASAPENSPAAGPEPAPVPEPRIAPAPESGPAADPEPEPAPVSSPAADHEPAPAPEPAPGIAPAPAPEPGHDAADEAESIDLKALLLREGEKGNDLIRMIENMGAGKAAALGAKLGEAIAAWKADGKEKLFSEVEAGLSFCVARPAQDPMARMEMENALGALMLASDRSEWLALVVQPASEGLGTEILRIDKNIFEPWRWKAVRQMGWKLYLRMKAEKDLEQ